MCDSFQANLKHDDNNCDDKENENDTFGNTQPNHNTDHVRVNNTSNRRSTDATPLEQSSLVRLLQRINRERDELALMVVQQSSEAATIQAQADLIPQYRQGE